MTDRIRLGMVGGGQDAFIGAVHRIAARLDDQFELVAGALSSTPEKARASGHALGLPRVYPDYKHMARQEGKRDDGIEAVVIVTPNNVHFDPARSFLRQGIHVICDKPLTHTLASAKKLVKEVAALDALFFLTHNYTAYPMIRQARAMIADGQIGEIRVVQVEYAQDWLSEDIDTKQAQWRTDPARSGSGGSIGDIGTHAFNLACFVSGLKVEELSAELHGYVPDRMVDDNAHIMLRFEGLARGMLWASQVAPSNENGLRLRIYGETGGLEWSQEEPNRLWFTRFGEPKQLLTRGGAGAWPEAARFTRVPSGLPEGHLEGFANLYSDISQVIRAHRAGQAPDPAVSYPTVQDGLAGMRFIDACLRSSAQNSKWMPLQPD